jgi:hypothetical protein
LVIETDGKTAEAVLIFISITPFRLVNPDGMGTAAALWGIQAMMRRAAKKAFTALQDDLCCSLQNL